jgi:multidrug resistance efflux pump
MSSVELGSDPLAKKEVRSGVSASPSKNDRVRSPHLIFRFGITFVAVILAALATWAMWEVYMAAPWTRDGQVRAYVVTMAPGVSGHVVELPVADNQLVHKGDLLMIIDPARYRIAVRLAEAAVQQAQFTAHNLEAEAKRRKKLSNLSISVEEQQTYESNALSAKAAYQKALANLDQARLDLDCTRIRSPVDGYVTNLLTQLGDYATTGQRVISIIDAASFWVDGYFEETSIGKIHDGDPATVKLVGDSQLIHGHVVSVARGITTPNARPDQVGLALVNPIFTWVRLAQRVPVRVQIDQVPDGIRLVAGMTATIQIDARPATSR